MQINKCQLTNHDQKLVKEYKLNNEIVDQMGEEINSFESFTENQLLIGHTNLVRGVDLCKSRNLLASGSADNSVKLWNLVNNAVIKTYKYSGQVLDVVFSQEGNLLAFGGGGNYSLMLINISNFHQDHIVLELCAHKHMINQITFSKNSKYLLSGSFDKTIRMWEVKSKREIFQFDSEGSVNGVAISGNDTFIASNSADRKIRIFEFQNKQLLCSQSTNEKGNGIQFSHDQKLLISSDERGNIKLWSLARIHQKQLLLIKRFKAATQCIWTMVISSCSKFIISICNEDSEIKVIYSQTGQVVKLFKSKQKNNYQMIDVAISKDMDILAFGEDNNVVLWRKK